ncbi:hypothetical protein HPB50_027509 [Hyalomma asiaticum]|uniref:Uncharacterized protein n=1 Tax=Hyalomma asiaticum TaxID=266040 RepID=A0ACB7TB11_HYAAI|nr:hypothetical protein HPB50_027509 [Hyalomma asiaticum]
MHYRLLEESVNQWKVELEELERSFVDQATQVNAWDRLLLSSAERVGQLSSLVERTQLDQQRLEHELDYVAAQQGELERLLAPLEAALKQAPCSVCAAACRPRARAHVSVGVNGAPLETQGSVNAVKAAQEFWYHMAENINSQLNCVSRDIKDIVEQLNAANAFASQDKPLQQISKVLNSHMDALAWVQHNSGVLQQKLQDLERTCERQRADPLLKR